MNEERIVPDCPLRTRRARTHTHTYTSTRVRDKSSDDANFPREVYNLLSYVQRDRRMAYLTRERKTRREREGEREKEEKGEDDDDEYRKHQREQLL